MILDRYGDLGFVELAQAEIAVDKMIGTFRHHGRLCFYFDRKVESSPDRNSPDLEIEKSPSYCREIRIHLEISDSEAEIKGDQAKNQSVSAPARCFRWSSFFVTDNRWSKSMPTRTGFGLEASRIINSKISGEALESSAIPVLIRFRVPRLPATGPS